MTGVLIVDDDYLARMYLRQLIQWEDEDCTLLGDAANGKQALELTATLAPQIILTDISMPVMDGVTFIRELKAQGCTARIAVLSCHDEFDYVKEAMRLGADEYILKNTLDADGLRALLSTLREGLLVSEQARKEQERILDLAAQGSRSVLESLLKTLCRSPLPYEAQKALLTGSGVHLPFYQCAALLISPAPQTEAVCQADTSLICIADGNGALALLCDLTGLHSAQEQREVVRRLAESCAGCAGDIATVVASAVCAGDGGLYDALQGAYLALSHAFYGGRLLFLDELTPFVSALPESAEQTLCLARQPTGDPAQFAALFTQVLRALAEAPCEPDTVCRFFARLDDACAQPDATPPRTFAECHARLAYYQRFLEQRCARQTLHTANPAVAQAADYLRAHYPEPVTLAQVADAVGLNPAYLSFVFKRDSGVNFSEFLLSCRLDAVKQGLRTTGLPIKDVAAAAGFFDYRHFCKLFKKETGLRPADFRKQASS